MAVAAMFLGGVGLVAASAVISVLTDERRNIPVGLAVLTGLAGLGVLVAFLGLGWIVLREALDTGTPELLLLRESAEDPGDYAQLTPREVQLLAGVRREVNAAHSLEEVVGLLDAKGDGGFVPANPKMRPVAFAIRPPSALRFTAGWALELLTWAAFVACVPVLFFLLVYNRGGWIYIVPVGVGLLYKAITYSRHARRYRLQSGRVFRRETRDPILYLRAFSEDYGGDLVGFFQETSEERLTHSLKRYGPVVAVGDPLEKLPRLGAVKLYFDASTWRLGVLYLMSISQLVIIQAGFAEGLLWELGVARRRLEPQRLIISFAAWEGLSEWQRQSYYTRFKNCAEELLQCGLPPEIKTTSHIAFGPGWAPVMKSSWEGEFETQS